MSEIQLVKCFISGMIANFDVESNESDISELNGLLTSISEFETLEEIKAFLKGMEVFGDSGSFAGYVLDFIKEEFQSKKSEVQPLDKEWLEDFLKKRKDETVPGTIPYIPPINPNPWPNPQPQWPNYPLIGDPPPGTIPIITCDGTNNMTLECKFDLNGVTFNDLSGNNE